MALQLLNDKVHSGWMYKRSRIKKKWKRRYFTLSNDLTLRYFDSESDATRFESTGSNTHLVGSLKVLDIGLIEVSGYNKLEKVSVPQYIRSKPRNKVGDEERCYIIRLVLLSRSYTLSAITAEDFQKWMDVFSRYVYGEILTESMGYRLNEKKRFEQRQSYLVLTQHHQLRLYNHKQRVLFYGTLDLEDVHSFHTEGVRHSKAPTRYLLKLIGNKKTFILCFDTKDQLKMWCRALETLNVQSLAATINECDDEKVESNGMRSGNSFDLITFEEESQTNDGNFPFKKMQDL